MTARFLLPCLLFAATTQAEVSVETGQLRLQFADNGDLVKAEACLPDCMSPLPHRKVLDEVLAFTSFATEEFALVRETAGVTGQTLDFADPANASYRRWTIPSEGYRIELSVRGAERLDLGAGDALQAPPGTAGFGVWLEQPRYLRFDAGEVEQMGLEESVPVMESRGWTGFRNRFWGLLARPEQPLSTEFAGTDSEPALVFATDPSLETRLSLYLGPIEPQALHSADPELEGLMYAGLWFWLRWICQGLYWLLGVIHALVPHWATAIVLLSIAVGILMRPLSRIADRLQDQVHRTEAKLAPELAGIKAKYRGAEQSERMIALYKKHGVHPLYSLKSLVGVAVVIPVFIGAFDMLAGNIWLSEQRFGWIDDLARPDALAPLPFAIPFFGAQFNALPFIMTGLSLWASSLHRHEAMEPAAQRRHRINLALMALAFLALFYTFPAGMVLYWTANNALSVIKYGWRNLRASKAAGS